MKIYSFRCTDFDVSLVLCLCLVPTSLKEVAKTQFVLLNHSSSLWWPAEGGPAPRIVWRMNGTVVQNSTSVRLRIKVTEQKIIQTTVARWTNMVSWRGLTSFMLSRVSFMLDIYFKRSSAVVYAYGNLTICLATILGLILFLSEIVYDSMWG